MEVRYYACIKKWEKLVDNNNNENAFLTYAFGNGKSYGSRYSYNIDSYYNYDCLTRNEGYFHVNWIYQSIDNGKTITDGNGSIWDLEPLRDYFKEIEVEFDDCVKTLIQLKRKKGNRVDIKPLMLVGDKIFYHVECAVTTRNSLSSTWCEGTDVYETIIECFKKLRTGTLSSYYNRIKDVLEKQNS